MNRYTIVMLGLSGSGKTTYLATLNHLLSRSLVANGVVIKVSPAADHAELEDLYEHYIDPRRNWPPSTLTAKEWTFTCEVRARGYSFPLLEFVYLDYRGELFERGRTDRETAKEIYDNLDRNAALLLLIDGAKVRSVLEQRMGAGQFYRENIDPLISWINYCPGPVHIAISKWDLLAELQRDIADVRDLLLDLEGGRLREIIHSRAASSRVGFRRGFVRMIPVSSMGGFAYLAPDGSMLKDPDTRPRPVNIDVPLVAVLPDLIIGAYEQAQLGITAAAKGKPPEPGSADWMAQFLEQAQDKATGRVLAIVLLVGAGMVGLAKVSGRMLVPMQALAVRLPRPLAAIRTRRTALIYAGRALTRRLRDFEVDYPGSRLS